VQQLSKQPPRLGWHAIQLMRKPQWGNVDVEVLVGWSNPNSGLAHMALSIALIYLVQKAAALSPEPLVT
jgi:hypothetical protein